MYNGSVQGGGVWSLGANLLAGAGNVAELATDPIGYMVVPCPCLVQIVPYLAA